MLLLLLLEPTASVQDTAVFVIYSVFGVAMVYCINTGLLCRSLGTESNQPPEMLVSKECGARKQFGKLPVVTGSSSPSDVWSLGCLLFELFTGNLLYPDSEDFSKFFSMLTGMSDEVYNCLRSIS